MIKLSRSEGAWIVSVSEKILFIGPLAGALTYAYGVLKRPIKVF